MVRRIGSIGRLGRLGLIAAGLLSGDRLSTAGEFGRAIVETTAGERIEGILAIDKTGLRVTDASGVAREVAPMLLRVARPLRDGQAGGPPETGHGLRGTYFKSKDLNGESHTRTDAVIDFAWGLEAPMPGFEPERFSVRWEGFLKTTVAGDHGFHVLSNDGGRLWIDGRLVVDHWHDQSDAEHSGVIALEAGKRYSLRMEMYEQGGTATARLFWTPPGDTRGIIPPERFFLPHDGSAPPQGAAWNPDTLPSGKGTGLRATYFASPNLDGFALERLDPEVNFNWGQGEVGGGIGSDNFGARWVGWVEAPVTGKVTFITRSDDGVRLWVDERQLVDQWHAMSVTEFSGQIDLEAGKKYPLKLEYYEASADASVVLMWQADGVGRQVVPSRFLSPGRAGDTRAPLTTRVHLNAGSVLTGNLRSADGRTLTLDIAEGSLEVPLRAIAVLQFGDLSDRRFGDLLARRPGCLGRDGDYFEASLLGYENGRLRFSSILFGLKSVEAGPVLAVLMGTRRERDAAFTVIAGSGTRILANELVAEDEQLKLLDNSFSRFALPLAAVEEIRGGGYR